MASHPRRTPVRRDGDGVRILDDAGVRRVAGVFGSITALVVAATAVVMLVLGPAPAAPGAPPPSLDAKDVVLALRAAGEHAGIAAFPLPGTKPLESGIIVPDDFELPPGYVRHHQTTDQGERLPAILMFHPDYELVDAQRKAVAVPENRVVPPELAPPGLPIRMLDLPEPGGGAGTRP